MKTIGPIIDRPSVQLLMVVGSVVGAWMGLKRIGH